MGDSKQNNEVISRATGLLIIEVRSSNPNGDPDRESDPRQRPDGKGEISPVSFKRKLRDLLEDKSGPVWQEVTRGKEMQSEKFAILESRGRKRDEIKKELEGDGSRFKTKYWDGRVFGNTFLEEDASTSIKTGVVQFGLGLSVAPIEIRRMTNTNKAGVEEGKDRGMAPMGYRIVHHGVYCMPFFVNPSMAHKTGCTKQDIDLLLQLIPLAYPHTRSYVRPMVEIRHAWYIEHKSSLGSCSDFALLDALTPKKRTDPDKPSESWDDYAIPTTLKPELLGKVHPLRDLMG
ncbi:MAG: type I CRISPR-associated protein Cas7 [Nitrospira sp.]|nr:type I CRISPR-associated protein Cas7 [Nitrospira sp.]